MILLNVFKINKNTKDLIIVNKEFFNDERLSYVAKGILIVILINDFKLSLNDLLERSNDDKETVMQGLNELINYGYIEKIN